MTKIKKTMMAAFAILQKRFIVAGLCMALSAGIMIAGICQGDSNSDTAVATKVSSDSETEVVLSSVEAVEVATVASVEQQTYSISESEYDALLKIVQAEAGGEDEIGKILVANVILNRVNNIKFPNTVGEVIYSPGQFTPTQYSSFSNIQPSESTKIAVDRALAGEDYSQGALYFCANSVSGAFSGYTQVLQYGGHTFFN